MATSLSSILGASAGARKWVSGRSYALDAIAWSPTNKLTYIRIVAGAGTTDPALDGTNWELFGPSRIKSIQAVSVTIPFDQLSAAATITATDPDKTELMHLGVSGYDTGLTVGEFCARIEQTDADEITVTRGMETGSQNLVVQVQIKEWW